jgi:hypothetical protein
MKVWQVTAVLAACLPQIARAQSPEGLAASALADRRFAWRMDSVPGIRTYFLPGSYAMQRRDSLVLRVQEALAHATGLLQAPAMKGPIDVFFIDSREEMRELTGAAATGFAHSAARAVFLVTNPEWRAFDRHEIMHVVAVNAWGVLGQRNPWLQEGLAQAADGRCAEFSNTDVAIALARRHGWIDLPTMLHRFREQPDLRAYLQAASLVDYLLRRAGPDAVRTVWMATTDTGTVVGGRSLTAWEAEWRQGLRATVEIPSDRLNAIEAIGCGIPGPSGNQGGGKGPSVRR